MEPATAEVFGVTVPAEVAVPGYVGLGLLVVSALHTHYTQYFYERKRFGLPFSKRLAVERSLSLGYVGAVVVGVIGFVVVFGYQTLFLDSLTIELQPLVQRHAIRYAVLSVVVVGVSQVVAGSSWSKCYLDGMLLTVSYLLIVSFVHELTIWTTISVILIGIGGLLAYGWRVWSSEFVEPRLSQTDEKAESSLARLVRRVVAGVSGLGRRFGVGLDDDARRPTNPDRIAGPSANLWVETPDEAESSLLFPHFPTFAYFVIASVYIVAGFLLLVVVFWNFPTP
jgi:hypothetical protein